MACVHVACKRSLWVPYTSEDRITYPHCPGLPLPKEVGNWFEFWLGVCGMSQDNVERLRWHFRFVDPWAGQPCNCPERIAWLNSLGGRLHSWSTSLPDNRLKRWLRWAVGIR